MKLDDRGRPVEEDDADFGKDVLVVPPVGRRGDERRKCGRTRTSIDQPTN